MSSGFGLVYLRNADPGEAFSFLHGYLDRAGVSLVNPYDGKVHIISEEGDQFDSSLGAILDSIRSQQEVRFQWWFESLADLYCRFRYLGDCVCIEPSLLRQDIEEDAITIGACLALFMMQVELGTAVGLVMDAWSISEDADWDSFFIDGKLEAFPDYLPDIVALKKEDISMLELSESCVRYEDCKDFGICTLRLPSDWRHPPGS